MTPRYRITRPAFKRAMACYAATVLFCIAGYLAACLNEPITCLLLFVAAFAWWKSGSDELSI